ncbi:hypothetical protein BTJ39_16915 [Izhakiella australiensis]|uniref:Flagellar protein FliT n=1 Tax=Izhakiella australiensis TaxID=1926881 RepID=A0A1S8YI66_9GAMM|nr:hypothetical protein [Izhakiella australiensis]OON38769.1 hypothetical protein BTJ39_16915 [Izhakiella australiensis]
MMREEALMLNNALHEACQSEDWLQVQSLDRDISNLLQRLRSAPPETIDMQALRVLQQGHYQVIQQSQRRLETLRQTLQRYHSSREGLQAYDLFSSTQGE